VLWTYDKTGWNKDKFILCYGKTGLNKDKFIWCYDKTGWNKDKFILCYELMIRLVGIRISLSCVLYWFVKVRLGLASGKPRFTHEQS